MRFVILFLFFYSSAVLGKDEYPQLKILKLYENVYQHISYKQVQPWGMVAASGLVVIDGNDAHIIDTPWSCYRHEKTN